MDRLGFFFLLLLSLASSSITETLGLSEIDIDGSAVDAEEAIMRRELEWAEAAMESYKRKNGKIPLRSSINAPHVHTEQWKIDSMKFLTSGNSRDASAMELGDEDPLATANNLRGRRF